MWHQNSTHYIQCTSLLASIWNCWAYLFGTCYCKIKTIISWFIFYGSPLRTYQKKYLKFWISKFVITNLRICSGIRFFESNRISNFRIRYNEFEKIVITNFKIWNNEFNLKELGPRTSKLSLLLVKIMKCGIVQFLLQNN